MQEIEIRFTQIQMQDAMSHYLNTVVLKQPVKVTSVEYNSSGNMTNTFSVKTTEIDVIDPDEVVGR